MSKKLKTDLNERERTRFAKEFREMAKAANEVADGLETEDDQSAIIGLLVLLMLGPIVSELQKIVTDAVKSNVMKDNPDVDFDELSKAFESGGRP